MARKPDAEKIRNKKNEIADTAVVLLYKKGYDNTSLNEIISQSGISKGVFYHYFKSKQDLLDYLVHKMSMEIYPQVERIVNNPDLDALAKMNKAFKDIKSYKVKHRKAILLLARQMYKPENLVVKQAMLQENRKQFCPLFAKIIKQGKKEGVMDVGNPEETAELLFLTAASVGEMIAPMLLKKKINIKNIPVFIKKALTARTAMRRILGIKKGNLNIFDTQTLKKFFQ